MNKKRIRDCMAVALGAISLGVMQGASAVSPISGWLVEDSFSPAVLLTELAGNLTIDSTYGMQLLATFERNRYSCSDRGGTGYVCTNEPSQAGDLYYLIGSASSMQGTVVPGPASFGLLGTALAGLGFVRSRRRTA